MPINPTTLKAQIDTEITNETVDFAITPSEVGGRMKDSIDYTTEQIALVAPVLKTEKTTITSAQILALFDTPITVLDNTTSGILKAPINIYIKRTAGTAYTLANPFLLLVNDFSTNVATMSSALLSNSTDGFINAIAGTTQTSSAATKSDYYKIKVNTSNPTGGTGDIDVYVTYAEITL